MADFIAIGDIVVDAFIKLKDPHIHTTLDHENQEICMPFAEKIPYDSVEEIFAVGNSANAATAAARLGLTSALVSNLGNDENGKKCLSVLQINGVNDQFVTAHESAKTNYHYVLWYGNDRTILVNHQSYDYKFPDIGSPKWLYLSSLGSSTEDYHMQIAEYLKTHPEISLAFQPGTFQMALGKEKLAEIYARTSIFFCNVEEAERILGISTLGIPELLKRVRELGPKIVVITNGPKGAYAYDGEKVYQQLPYPDPKPPLERTGAGDSFASTTVSALALGLNLQAALSWGAVNSMSVVQEVGAQKGLLTQEKIEEYLKNAPPEFQTQVLN